MRNREPQYYWLLILAVLAGIVLSFGTVRATTGWYQSRVIDRHGNGQYNVKVELRAWADTSTTLYYDTTDASGIWGTTIEAGDYAVFIDSVYNNRFIFVPDVTNGTLVLGSDTGDTIRLYGVFDPDSGSTLIPDSAVAAQRADTADVLTGAIDSTRATQKADSAYTWAAYADTALAAQRADTASVYSGSVDSALAAQRSDSAKTWAAYAETSATACTATVALDADYADSTITAQRSDSANTWAAFAETSATACTATVALDADYADSSGGSARLGGRSIGTSGTTIPLLDGVNTWSGLQTFDAGATISAGQSLTIATAGVIQGVNNTVIKIDTVKIDAIRGKVSSELIANVSGNDIIFQDSVRAGFFVGDTIISTYCKGLDGWVDSAVTCDTATVALDADYADSAITSQRADSANTWAAFAETSATACTSTVALFADSSQTSDTATVALDADYADSAIAAQRSDSANTWSAFAETSATACTATVALDADYADTSGGSARLGGRSIGTSGTTIPLLDGANTYSGKSTFSDSIIGTDIRFTGDMNVGDDILGVDSLDARSISVKDLYTSCITDTGDDKLRLDASTVYVGNGELNPGGLNDYLSFSTSQMLSAAASGGDPSYTIRLLTGGLATYNLTLGSTGSTGGASPSYYTHIIGDKITLGTNNDIMVDSCDDFRIDASDNFVADAEDTVKLIGTYIDCSDDTLIDGYCRGFSGWIDSSVTCDTATVALDADFADTALTAQRSDSAKTWAAYAETSATSCTSTVALDADYADSAITSQRSDSANTWAAFAETSATACTATVALLADTAGGAVRLAGLAGSAYGVLAENETPSGVWSFGDSLKVTTVLKTADVVLSGVILSASDTVLVPSSDDATIHGNLTVRESLYVTEGARINTDLTVDDSIYTLNAQIQLVQADTVTADTAQITQLGTQKTVADSFKVGTGADYACFHVKEGGNRDTLKACRSDSVVIKIPGAISHATLYDTTDSTNSATAESTWYRINLSAGEATGPLSYDADSSYITLDSRDGHMDLSAKVVYEGASAGEDYEFSIFKNQTTEIRMSRALLDGDNAAASGTIVLLGECICVVGDDLELRYRAINGAGDDITIKSVVFKVRKLWE